MLGLGLIFPVLILAELQAYGTAYFLLINISIIASAKLVDDIENKWMKKHKAHAHYLVLGNSITVIIMMLVNYLWI